jgi:hypothetical protein
MHRWQCTQHVERSSAHLAPVDQHITIAEVAEIDPACAVAASLEYPLDAILAFDHTPVAISDDAGIGVVTLPRLTLTPS